MSADVLTPAPRPGSPASFRPPPSTTAGGPPVPSPLPPPSPGTEDVEHLADVLGFPLQPWQVEYLRARRDHPAGKRRPTERPAP